jgi:hypothetical protein
MRSFSIIVWLGLKRSRNLASTNKSAFSTWQS